MLRLGVRCLIVAIVALCSASAAGAAYWVVGRFPVATSGVLDAVSCSSSTACTAVGHYGGDFGVNPGLVARWDGKAWSLQQPAVPAGADGFVLTSVSCPSRSDCVAAGYAIPHLGSDSLLVERWNGKAWSVQPTPNPAAVPGGVYVEARLWGISCVASAACTAVGDYDAGTGVSRTLVERWNGVEWTIESSPNPGDLNSDEFIGDGLKGVSCASRSSCASVGSMGVYHSLAQRWNGLRWTNEAIAEPKPEIGSSLSGVACPDATTCLAVGQARLSEPDGTGGTVVRAALWDGGEWSSTRVTPPSDPPGGPHWTVLNGVSCASSMNCIGVGAYQKVSYQYATLAERWNGRTWAMQPSDNPAGDLPALNGVSCSSPTNCIAVGEHAITGETTNDFSLPLVEMLKPSPTNRLGISGIRQARNGTISFRAALPGRGTLDVLETAWNDNFARAASLLQPAPKRFVFARKHVNTLTAKSMRISVAPDARGRRLVRHHRYRVTLRLWVTYTPIGGRPRSLGFYGLRLPEPRPKCRSHPVEREAQASADRPSGITRNLRPDGCDAHPMRP